LKQGKITLMNMIVFCILVLAGVMALKHAAGAIDKKQIKKEIYDEMGIFRGAALTEGKVEQIITDILAKRGIEPLDISYELDDKQKIHYYYKYELTINYLLFKRSEIVEVEGEMENYGG
jgi:hypothetical protein